MRDFNSGNRSRDRRDSPRRSFGGRDQGGPSLHDAVCAECGKDCQVPFRPSGDKPVYCSDCFEKKGGGDGRRSGGRRDFSRRGAADRGSRSSQGNPDQRSLSQLVGGIETLNTKLDTIIGLLSPAGEKKQEPVESKPKTATKPTAKKTVKVTEVPTPVKKKTTKSLRNTQGKPLRNTQDKLKKSPKKS